MYLNWLWTVKKGLISGELDLWLQLSQAKCDQKGWEEDQKAVLMWAYLTVYNSSKIHPSWD
jgi:hypothetical protein